MSRVRPTVCMDRGSGTELPRHVAQDSQISEGSERLKGTTQRGISLDTHAPTDLRLLNM